MPNNFNLKPILILSVLFIITSAIAGVYDDNSWAVPGETIEAGEINIKVIHDVAPLRLNNYDGIVMTGIAALDAVADAFGVYQIRKTFQMKSPPDDPTVPDLSRYYSVSFPKEYGPFAMVEAYENCPEVIFAEFVSINYKCFIPNDPRFRNQWHLSHCDLPDAWDVSHGSEEIIIGIVDSGLDMDAHDDGWLDIHEDFAENLWQNLGEDLNNDGVITWEDDTNGEDDDDNGFADDFHGWDFTGNDNWPDDDWGADGGHGTHVAGIASAVTNNEVGISGAAFSCKLMISAHWSTDSAGGGVRRGYEGVEYCAANGANIINLSWGHYGPPYRSQSEVIAWAQSQGAIIFAGVGNDDTNDQSRNNNHFYPAAYDDVIGVGACDDRDRKCDFSNYGDYTDLVTPGEFILSARPRNDYVSWQGTSMSSPFAAGIGALMLSVEPDLNDWQLLEWMQRTAVDISDVGNNANYPGIVYRVDAGRLLHSTHPNFQITDWHIIEVVGDQDGRIERSERISIVMTLANEEDYANAHNVTINLESDDPYVSIISEEAAIGDLDNGHSYELWDDEYPTFHVHGNSPIHYSTFVLTITSDEGYPQNFEYPFTIRQPLYLLVDDDDGEDFETFYDADLMERPIVHDTWDIAEEGAPSQELLNSYNFVVWETGNDEHPLTQAEQELITSYLNDDGYLMLSGQYIGDDIGDTEFHQNYLKARHVSDHTGGRRLTGNADNPVSNGVDILLVGGGAAGNGTVSPSSMEPVNGAEAFLYYYNTDEIGGIYYAGDYHLVYLGFALEAVSGGGDTTPRSELLERILDHFYELGVSKDTPVTSPNTFTMKSPYPNPFNSRTGIQVNVPNKTHFTLEVMDVTGRSIEFLYDGAETAGQYTYYWNAESAPAGVYIINLQWDGGVMTRKVVLVK
ncbi:MAG: S8 family peptidase [Candidatus Hatepunaea meridiana]|nr:S8 family peptidase [Candidatus Hatepunaea meridiana]